MPFGQQPGHANEMPGASQRGTSRPGGRTASSAEAVAEPYARAAAACHGKLRKQHQQVPSSCPSRSCFARSTASDSSRKCWSISGSTTSTCSPARADADLPRRVRARRDSPARARQLPRPARRDRAEPRDAVLSRQLAEQRSRRAAARGAEPVSGAIRCSDDMAADACAQAAIACAAVGRPAQTRRGGGGAAPGARGDVRRAADASDAADPAAAAARAQRELRARADGAAHARRRRRLHAAGRHRSRAGPDRLDDRAAAATAAASSSASALPRRAARRRVLGKTIDRARRSRRARQVLDLLARASVDARRSSRTKLARRFVADEPPEALVDRAARRRSARRRATCARWCARSSRRPEFFAPAAYRAKVKTPFEFVASALRVTGARIADAATVLVRIADLGSRSTAQAPTGYSDRADAWMNTGALAQSHELRGRAGRRAGARRACSRRGRRRKRRADATAAQDAVVASLPRTRSSDATRRADREAAAEANAVAALALDRRVQRGSGCAAVTAGAGGATAAETCLVPATFALDAALARRIPRREERSA